MVADILGASLALSHLSMAVPISAVPPRPVAGTSLTPTPRYGSALAAVTTLFFLWGFITSLNDILIPYLKAIFQLSYTQANLINLCFFGAYFLMSIPAGSLVKRVGYKRGMLLGFVIAAVGAFLFYPAAEQRAYGLFLGALFVLASGITLLQVAANPYVAILGPPQSASSRLTLTQAFNSVGTTLGPVLGATFLLSRLPKLTDATAAASIDVRAVQLPYLVVGGMLLLISLMLSRVNLPQIVPAEDDTTRHYPHQRLAIPAPAAGRAGYFHLRRGRGCHWLAPRQLPGTAHRGEHGPGRGRADGGVLLGRGHGRALRRGVLAEQVFPW